MVNNTALKRFVFHRGKNKACTIICHKDPLFTFSNACLVFFVHDKAYSPSARIFQSSSSGELPAIKRSQRYNTGDKG
jgi:hypothetical protein